MPNPTSRRILTSYTMAWLVAVVITLVVASLVVDSADRGEKYWLTLLSFLFVETSAFGLLCFTTVGGRPASSLLPWHYGTGTFFGLYSLGVLCLAGVSALPVSFNVLLALHLGWFLILAVGLSLWSAGAISIDSLQSQDKQQRAGWIIFRNRFADVDDRLAMVSSPDLEPLRHALKNIGDELEYATSDSPPGSEAIEAELNACLDEIETRVQRLEDLDSTTDIDTARPALEEAGKKATRMLQMLARREDLIAQLR